MRRPSETTGRSPIRFGLRPRLLGALVFTAAATLAVAALALLTPLESQLRKNQTQVVESQVSAAQTRLGEIKQFAPNGSYRTRVKKAAFVLAASDHVTVVVWTRRLRHLADTDHDVDARLASDLARWGFTAPTANAKAGKSEEINSVLYLSLIHI